mmetsp:Transcript_24573/g.80536  ORF Transcript_24573/g.80536 Transcript_24573/m.80536 type:complete len:157 (-) Transcript_24573:4625-5095(-)
MRREGVAWKARATTSSTGSRFSPQCTGTLFERRWARPRSRPMSARRVIDRHILARRQLGCDLHCSAYSRGVAVAPSLPMEDEAPPPLGSKSVSEFFEKPQGSKKSISFGVMNSLTREEAEESTMDEEREGEGGEDAEDLPWKDSQTLRILKLLYGR